MLRTFLFLFALLLIAPAAFAQNEEHGEHAAEMSANEHATEMTADEHGVHMAILDYVEGLYEVAPERIERSVSRDLVKFGYWRSSPDEEYSPSPMNFEQLRDLAAGWNEGGRMNITGETPKEIEILDVLDKTAAAKLTAFWGIDYFQLEKIGGRWMIRHVLWQAHPAGS